MKDRNIRTLRVSHASMDATLAAIAGSQKACTTLGRGGGTGGGEAWVGVLFGHECFEAFSAISKENNRTRRGIWLRDRQSPLGLVSGHLGFRPRVPVAVQFSHWEWGLRICAWADNGVPRCGAHALGVSPTKAVLEEDLEGGCHSVVLSKG